MRLRVLLTLVTMGASAIPLTTQTADAGPVVAGRFDNGDKKAKKSKKAAKPAGKKKANRAGHVEAKIRLNPDGVRWGMSLNELSKAWDKEIDRIYLKRYKKVEPGPRMKELDAEVADMKQFIKRNHIEFGSLPSGLDNTPLGGEFAYDNGESMTKLTLPNGEQDYYFFHNGGLYKTYKVKKLSKKSKLGRDFDAVVEKLSKQFKSKPEVLEEDAEKGIRFDGVQWTNGETILRILDREGGKIAVVYIDHRKEERLADTRGKKKDTSDQVSSDVAAVTKDPTGAPPPPGKK